MTEDDIINGILAHEGGYIDHPADKGGPTNMGITLKTLEAYRRGATIDMLKALTEKEARGIYSDLYIHSPGFWAITDDKLRALVIDCGVNHGIFRAAKWLQEALDVTTDGIIGKGTLDVLATVNPRTTYNRVLGLRARLFGALLANPSQAVFARGWMNRLADWIEGA